MYISIDMDALRFLHKHQDQEVVSAISWLECGQHVSIRIDNIEGEHFLRGVAHGDLCHLYQNITGDNFHEQQWGDRADQFRERLREAARNVAATVALADEALAQADLVDDKLHAGERFKYALGSRVPAQAQELFPLQPVPLAPTQITAADARAAGIKQMRQQREEAERQGAFLPGAQPDHDHTVVTEHAPPAAPEQPKLAKARTGSVQPVVFAAAKAAWEARAPGVTWDQLRPELAKKLEADGFHPTTVRIKLSKWAKENGIGG